MITTSDAATARPTTVAFVNCFDATTFQVVLQLGASGLTERNRAGTVFDESGGFIAMPDVTPSESETAWVTRVLGVPLSGGGAGAGSGQIRGLDVWQAARTKAIGTLSALEAAFRKMDEPEVDDAIILLRAIRANLTEAPVTWRQVDELRRYLSDDEIIDDAEEPNGFGIIVSLREPLLTALDVVWPVS